MRQAPWTVGLTILIAATTRVAPVMADVNCTLIVPKKPLSEKGLATPYRLLQGCDEANQDESAFVQAAIYDPKKKRISVYNPLVINDGDKPARDPVRPNLPDDAVVGLWFGSNADTLLLQGETPKTLQKAKCINGKGDSIFGQVSACNAAAFFKKAAKATPSPLGTAIDGLPCPTIRDFFVVDQDQSDNDTTTYLIVNNKNGTKIRMAQNTAANRARWPVGTTPIPAPGMSFVLENGSDNQVLIRTLGLIGCTPSKARDLADKGALTTALPLNELSARAYQQDPIALIPLGDPMTLVDGQPDLEKMNLYRLIMGQPLAADLADPSLSTETYCRNMLAVAPPRLFANRAALEAEPSPFPDVGNSFFTFLAKRFAVSFGPVASGGLGCTDVYGIPQPIVLTFDENGVVIDATLPPAP